MSMGTADPATDGALPADQLTETEEAKVAGRSLSQIAWARLKRDRVAMLSAIVIVVVVLIAVLAGVWVKLTGAGGPNEPYIEVLDPTTSMPQGGLLGSGMSSDHLLGVEPQNGRDVLSRLIYGARPSLIVATLATAFSVIVGTVVGMLAGYLGGWVDAVLGRVMDIMLSFPSLLFTMAITPVVADWTKSTAKVTNPSVISIGVLVFVLGFFGWAYLARIVRGQTLSLREREFVDSARSIGGGTGYVIFRQILPNLVPTLLVFATLALPTNITAEAALSYLGVGVQEPTASWGKMIADASGTFQVDPLYLFFPGMMLLITVLAFNLLGDSVRDALDPRAGRS